MQKQYTIFRWILKRAEYFTNLLYSVVLKVGK